MIALIDGDIFRYRCAFAAERTKYLVVLRNPSNHKEYAEFDSKKEADAWVERVTGERLKGASTVTWSRKDLQPIENCLQIVKSCVENTLEEIRANGYPKLEYRIWLSGKKNFRDVVAVSRPYKGNRDSVPKPSYYMDVATYLVEHWDATWTEGIEADDAVGIAAMEAKERGQDYCIVSNDKDLKQIPGLHYDWIKKEFHSVSPKDAKFQLFSQILSGDATDNIPGLEGIGPAKAAKILEGAQSPEEMVDRVVEQYKSQQMDHVLPSETHLYTNWKEYIQEQWALVYILRQPLSGGMWRNTREGQYFCSKYLRSSDVATSSSL